MTRNVQLNTATATKHDDENVKILINFSTDIRALSREFISNFFFLILRIQEVGVGLHFPPSTTSPYKSLFSSINMSKHYINVVWS